MSKKKFRGWGLILTLMLVVSTLVPAAPAAASYGQSEWVRQSLPTANGYVMQNGSDVSDLALGPGALYAVDGTLAANRGYVFKSTDGGASWTRSTQTAAVALQKIAVAPDNANVIAVTDGASVYISSDAGSTWAALPALGGVHAGGVITDLSVAPARSGTLLGREYIISVADPTGGMTARGDVLIIGSTAAWATVGGGITGTRDFVAVTVTPNFAGDRSVVALGATAAAGGLAVQVINTATNTLTSTALLNGAGTTIDFLAPAAAGTNIQAGSVSLPSDFDATTSSGRRGYVGVATNTAQADNDVYRFDDTAAKALGAVTAQKVYSVAYSGSISAGTLFMGRQDMAEVKWSTDMTASSPTWTNTKKLMPTTTTNHIVVVTSDFATTKKVYVGNCGVESALSISTDGGISFNQKSLIDNGIADNVVKIESGPSLMSNGKSFLLSTLAGGKINLWKSDTPTSDSSWTRIFVSAGTKGSIDKINDNVIVYYDVVAGGNIYRSADGGATWSTRSAPAAGFLVEADVFQDEDIGWVSDLAGNIYKTKNGAWTWTGPVNASVGNIKTITTGRIDEIIVGGTGKIAISKDGGSTFTPYTGDAGVFYHVITDSNYSTNNILWLADAAGVTNAVYQFKVGTDLKPVDLLALSVARVTSTKTVIGITVMAGTLYAAYGDRLLRSLDPQGRWTFPVKWSAFPKNATQSAGIAMNSFATTKDTHNICFLRRSSTPEIWAFQDQMATAKPKIVAPADNLTLAVDPVTGAGERFTLSLQPVGTGNALADKFNIQIDRQDAGKWSSAAFIPGIQVTSPSSPQISSALLIPTGTTTPFAFQANQTYRICAYAAHQVSGSSLGSQKSDAVTIKVASGGVVRQSQHGLVLLAPQGGATGVPTTPGFVWAPAFGAKNYRVVIATDAALTKTVGGTPKDVSIPSFQPTSPLAYETGYFWSVQVIEPGTGPVSIGTFTTAPMLQPGPMSEPVPIIIPPIIVPPIAVPPTTIEPLSLPAQPTPIFTVQAVSATVQTATPNFIWAVIIIGVVLIVAVLFLILRTRRIS